MLPARHRQPVRLPAPPRTDIDWRERVVFVLSGLLLTVAFIGGGSSQQSGWGVTMAELLALAVLLVVCLPHRWRHHIAAARWALAVLGLILAIPLLQLLQIPGWLWQWPPPRAALQHDLASAGIAHFQHRWSLAPAATERDWLELLPGAALFVAALVLRRESWRRLLWWFMGMVLFSVVLAFAQLRVPQHSFLNPFPQYAPAFAGVFANQNHQACAMAMALVLAVTLMFDARARIRRRQAAHATVVVCAIVVVMLVAILPLVHSRAGVIEAIVGVACALLVCGAWSRQRLKQQRLARWWLAIAVVILAAGLYGALAWMQLDASVAGLRWQMAGATARLAGASMPLGSGFGSFVRMFEQYTQGSLMHHGSYINAAHNDYLQWWMAGGVLAIVAMIATAAVLIVATLRLLKLPVDSGLRNIGMAALLAILMPLLHSTVDYPLRTPALMTSFGLLAGIAVAAGARAKTRAAARQAVPPAGPEGPSAASNVSV